MIAAMSFLTGILVGVTIGCANTPPSPFSEPPIRVATDQGVRVIAPTFELAFASAGIHLPERLIVNKVDVLGVDDPCLGENRIGFAVAPAVQASAAGSAGTSEITVLAAGPAMAKIRVTYEINYACPNNERMTGATEFTILPGGRIVREDIHVQPSTNTLSLLSPGGRCGCRQSTNNVERLFFSSFWAFDPSDATQVDKNGTQIFKGTAVTAYQACTMYSQHAIGVAWTELPGTSTRFYSPNAATPTRGAVLHSLDFPTIDDRRVLEPTPRSITSAIQISATPPARGSDCGKIIALLADVPLTIGAMRFAYTDHDGIYRDPAIHSAAFDIVASDTAVPAGFAISVDLGGANHAVITRADGVEPASIAQRESGGRFVIVFNDGLALGERLTIDPRL